ncbi:DUF4347 domain-containing protein [Granulosicoccus antarcticus]|uniref:Serine/threonine-protein kinase PknD n=1 Tax=Granulosicoccus antarcticus IMCC3135 TaxID=1192854 RepID=A0A2Z2NJE4_9GAMM|nr:DUF4347 domain-containing protein [Granulosicoccus antarcticus]ASJ70625.1 Serine/threonine-protein kinase PknD [Granulosicoccus antarcticus IMCC3135]
MNQAGKPDSRGKTAFQLETLEKRILFSADLPLPVLELSSSDSGAHIGLISSIDSSLQSSTSAANSEQHRQDKLHVVIIDPATPDYESIVAELENQAGDSLQVHVLDADRDGITQISAIVAQYESIGTLHLVVAGSESHFNMGDSTVDLTELLVRADELADWQDSFTVGADMLIHGFDQVSGDVGHSLLSTLSNLTSTDVSVSDEHAGNIIEQDRVNQLEPTTRQSSSVAAANALPAQEPRRELVFVDSRVEDYETLIQDIRTSTDSSRTIDVMILDPTRDGVEQIAEILTRYESLDAIHIVSHGDEGTVQLGDTWLSNKTLSSYTHQLASWSDALSQDADLLFYGCDLAGSDSGKALIASLARLTDADVNASSDRTGSANLGGNWNLESRTGDIETTVAFSTEARQKWQGILASFTVDTLLDTADATPGDGIAEDAAGNTSLRAAMEEANALGGAHTISLGAGTYTLSLGELEIDSDITLTGAGTDQTFISGDELSRVINIASGTVTLSGLTIQDGDAAVSAGGGININGTANVTLDTVNLISNTGKDGGAINNAGALIIQSSTIDGNTSTNKGGGIHSDGSLTLTDTTLSNNSALSRSGGGVFDNGAPSSFTNVTISGNYAKDPGGGIYTQGAISLQNVTITENVSDAEGGGIAEAGSSTTLHNVIVAGNSAVSDSDVHDTFSSSGGNLIGDVGTATGLTDGVNSDQVGSTLSPVDARLGPLADNGGPTLTHALLAGSSAIDGGTATGAPATDQNGTARNDGSVDIGAFEFTQQAAPVDLQVVSATDGSLSVNEDGGNDAYLIADAGSAIFGGLTDFTLEARFSADTPPLSNYSDFISYAIPSESDEVRLAFEHTSASASHIELTINGVIVESTAYNANVLFDGKEHTLSATWSSLTGAYEVLVDGISILSGTGLSTGHTLLAGGQLTMIRDQDSPGGDFDLEEVFQGKLHDFRIFNDVRSNAEILDNYLDTLVYDEPGMIANWTFNTFSLDSTTGNRIVTDSVSGNNLTAMNVGAVGGYVTSTPELLLAVEENSADGTVVGAVSGTDTQRDTRIAALLAADSSLAYNAETGKFYRHVNSAVNFITARDAATGSNLNGIAGQLVTVDSANENELVLQYVLDSGNEIWLGASDAGTEGEWHWLDGASESSEKFWSGGATGARVDGEYASHMGLSDAAGEDFLRITATGAWYDNNGSNFTYIVEWNADEVLDATDALTYTIQSQTETSAFAIDADTGVISVADGSKLDYETNSPHILTIRVTDGDSNIFEKNVNVLLNDLPDDASWTVPIGQTTNEDTSFTFSTVDGNAIEFSSGKPANQPASASLSVSSGTLTLGSTAGITFLDGTGDGEAALVVFGTEAAINSALDGLSYSPGENYHGSDSLIVTTGSSAATEAGLHARFDFENGVFTDQSGNGNHASTSSDPSKPSPGTDSERGDVLDFDGDDKLTVSNGTQGLGGELTLASWVNLDAIEEDNVVLSLADQFYIELDNHNPTAGFGVSYTAFGTSHSTASTYDVAGDGWHHLAVTFSDTSDEVNFFVDGVLVNTASSAAVPDWSTYSTQDIAIGSLVGSQAGSVPMAGSLDDVRIYNAALSENEIVLMMGHQGHDTATVGITVEPINDSPLISAPVAVTVAEEAPLVFSAANGNQIIITDVDGDSGGEKYSVQVVMDHGTATLASLAGLDSVSGDGSDYIDIYGTLASVNNALEGLTYVGPTDYDEATRIRIFVSELYFNPPSDFGILEDEHTIAVAITPVNDVPVTVAESYSVIEDETLTVAASGVLSNDSDPDSTDPALVSQFGIAGTLDGEFTNPRGIEFDASGNLYVADRNNHRIQIFDSGGNHLLTFGSSGTADGQFNSPADVAIDSSGNIFVVENNNDRIQKFDSAGNHLLTWGVTGAGDSQFENPSAIAVDASDNIYVTDTSNDRVQKFDNLGNHLLSWGNYGTADGQFDAPLTIAIDANGVIWVGESGNRIQQFDTSGNHLLTFGSSGNDIGELSGPSAIAFDADGYAYIADNFNQRIQVFDSAGNYRLDWGTYGTAAGEFAHPAGIAVDSTGQVWVADTNNSRIQIFAATEASGEVITATLVSGPSHASGFTLNADGSFTYTPDTDWNGTDSFVYEADDGNGGRTQQSVTIDVGSENDAPVLDNSGATTLPTITKFQTNNGGTDIASILASAGDPITDADTDALEGIAITTLASGNGTWEYLLNGAGSWAAIGSVTTTSALLLGADDLVRFVPNGVSGTTASFDFHAWDQTTGTAGTKADASTGGGNTAYSTASESAAITVVDANTAPVLDNAQSPIISPVDEDAGVPTGAVGSLVSELVDFATPSGQVDNVTDPDSGAGLGIAISAADTSNGTWFYSTNNGSTWNTLGAVSDTNARLLAADASTRLFFQANADYHGTLANAITFHAWDQTSGSNGTTTVLTGSGSETVLDNFSTVSYSNNNGSQSWSTGWIEVDSGGGLMRELEAATLGSRAGNSCSNQKHWPKRCTERSI